MSILYRVRIYIENLYDLPTVISSTGKISQTKPRESSIMSKVGNQYDIWFGFHFFFFFYAFWFGKFKLQVKFGGKKKVGVLFIIYVYIFRISKREFWIT